MYQNKYSTYRKKKEDKIYKKTLEGFDVKFSQKYMNRVEIFQSLKYDCSNFRIVSMSKSEKGTCI